MKTFYSFVTLMIISIILFGSSAQAQLTGIKTIKASGGDYATFTAAINALNTSGVGTGGVIFNVSAGFTVTELCPAITATGTSANPIVFQKSGAGANPIITAGTGAGTTDGIIRISGGDYITFDGIDVKEAAANINTTTQMEYGYYISNASVTNGAMYNTIKNCKITLNRANTATRALYQAVYYAPGIIEGANSYNKFQSVVIENSYQGIYVTGNATYPDLDMEISNCTIGASTANDIGNGSATTNGIRMTSVRDANVFGNEVRNLTVTGAVVPYGIYLELLQGTCNIYNNKVHDIKSTSTSTSSIIYGIRTDINSSYTCNVYNNFVYELYHGATTANATIVIRGITVALSGTGTGNVYYNSVRIGEDAKPSSAAMYVGTNAGNINIKNNIFANYSTAGATSLRYCIYKGNGSIINDANNNDYYIDVAGTNNNVGYFTANCNTLANWQTASSVDANSISTNPPFTSTTDLHISTGTPTLLESGGTPISGITADIDGNPRNASTPDIGADEGNFTAVSKTVSQLIVNQASTAAVYANTADQEILRVDISVFGTGGTLPLNSIVVNSTNTRDIDVSNVKLYTTSTPTFSTANPLGSSITFSGGVVSFNSLNYDLPGSSITYIWIVYDIAPDAIDGNTLDAIILANHISINGSTYPSADADPTGSRIIVSQMNGTYTVDQFGSGSRNYTTISSAISDLNYKGISGSTIFNVAAGFTENISSSLLITATGTSSNTITFQKSGSGANPLITRSDAGSITPSQKGGLGDAIFILEGSDYVTVDGIDVQASQSTIEYGYYLRKVGTTNTSDGCKNDVIKNCTVTMTKGTSAYVVGICSSNNTATTGATSSTNTGATVDSEGGRNENITITGNTIQSTFEGIDIIGYNHTTSPYNFFDQNFVIGGESGAGNTIRNYGGNTASNCSGIYASYQNNENISYNTINNTDGGGTGFTSYSSGINLNYGKSINVNVSYNIISLNSASGSNYMYGIYNNAGDVNSTLNVHHNIVENCSHSSSGAFSAFNNGVSVTLNLYSNTVRNNTINLGYSTMLILGSASTANVYDNIISNTTIAGGTSTNSAISSAGTDVNIYGNSISGYTSTAAARVYLISITGGTSVKVYNNLIYDIESMYSHSKIDAIRGISITSSTTASSIGVYFNTIYLDASTGGTDSWTSCVYDTSFATSTTASLDMRNNILVNASTPSGAGIASAFRRGGATLNNYSTLSNNNLLYAGAPGVSNLIFYDGTNSYQTLADFKAAVGATRESYSVSGDPGFTSSTNLIPDPTNHNSWILSGNGIHIAGITTDFAGTTRPTVISEGAPDIGAYEFTAGSTTPNSFVIVPVSGSNDVYVNGRKLINLYFSNLGGISSIDVKFYSGVIPPGTSGYPVMNGYFVVTQTGGSGFVYDLTYYYSESQIGTIANESLIRLSKSDNGGTNWTAYTVLGTGQEQYLLDNTANTVKVHQLNSFSIFTNGDGNAPLPVQLSSLSSLLNGRDVKLLWKTDKETNNAGFDVERKTEGSNLWCTVGFVKGNGSSNTPSNYSFLDKKLNSGKYNYRLKQIDYNGNFEYHNLAAIVDVSLPTKFSLSQNYPNPFNPTTKIDFDLPFDSKVSIILYDITGREVKTLVNDTRTAGFHTVQFNASGLSSGTYFYRIMTKSNSGDYVITKKMVLVK